MSVLAETANVTESCKRVGIGRITVYQRRGDDPSFAEDWDRPVGLGTAALEAKRFAERTRAMDEPVFYKGEHCGDIRRYATRC